MKSVNDVSIPTITFNNDVVFNLFSGYKGLHGEDTFYIENPIYVKILEGQKTHVDFQVFNLPQRPRYIEFSTSNGAPSFRAINVEFTEASNNSYFVSFDIYPVSHQQSSEFDIHIIEGDYSKRIATISTFTTFLQV